MMILVRKSTLHLDDYEVMKRNTTATVFLIDWMGTGDVSLIPLPANVF